MDSNNQHHGYQTNVQSLLRWMYTISLADPLCNLQDQYLRHLEALNL